MALKPARHIEERAITDVIPVKGGFLLVQWDGRHLGFVDLRDMIADMPVFEFLRDKDAFDTVRIEEGGGAVFWIDHDDDVVDIDSETLWGRRKPVAATPPGPRPVRRLDLAPAD